MVLRTDDAELPIREPISAGSRQFFRVLVNPDNGQIFVSERMPDGEQIPLLPLTERPS